MTDNHFHINVPYFGAWTKYGWGKDDWGLGLNKERVDGLAKQKATLIVSYGKSNQEYTIGAEKAQTYPIKDVKNFGVKLYIIPKSALHFRQPPTEEQKLKQLVQEISL
jgi:hypothetical protein